MLLLFPPLLRGCAGVDKRYQQFKNDGLQLWSPDRIGDMSRHTFGKGLLENGELVTEAT